MNKQQNNHTYASLTGWADQASIPFNVQSPEIFSQAADKVMALAGEDVQILALGEPYHVMQGDERFLKLRNELFKHLVEKHGYTAIAIESSFVRSPIINDYINGGESSYDSIKKAGFSQKYYKYETTGELIEWMRDYNADLSHTRKLHFYGFDAPTEMTSTDSPRGTLNIIFDYLIDNKLTDESHRQRINELIGEDAKWESMDALMDASKSIGQSDAAKALRLECEDLITLLELHRPDLIAATSTQEYLYAAQIAGIARQLLDYHAAMAQESDQRLSNLLGIRDAIMANNLQFILERERGRGKVFAHAQNRHMQYGSVEWQLGTNFNKWWPAGAHLSKMLGKKYVVIGSALHTSEIEGIGEPETGTLEALLVTSNLNQFIPTHGGHGLPQEEIANLQVRSIGDNPGYMPLDTKSFTDFDWLVIL